MVLVGILVNKNDINRLDTQMSRLNDQMSKLNDKVDAMKDSFHNDVIMLLQRDADKDTRLARLEERLKSSR
jgi:hypothetical protein